MTRPAEKSADLIVRGRMQIVATDDASIGTIAVDTVYAGPAIPNISFIAPGMDAAGTPWNPAQQPAVDAARKMSRR